jgi:uncharacterized protein (TIGR04255 family)
MRYHQSVRARIMAEPLPQFDEPPVVETVLGVQFDRLPDFSPAHAGWFWREVLPKSWSKAKEVPRLPDAFEKFGDEDKVGVIGLGMRPPEPERIQLIEDADERMIQVQDSRFILNWRKRGSSPYPSYVTLLPEFREKFEAFRRFAISARLGDLNVNQWEVTYVNHVPRGELWHAPSDFRSLFPGLIAEVPAGGLTIDHLDCDWRFAMPDRLGRLHVGVKHAQLRGEPRAEVAVLSLTARGPVDPERQTWEQGFQRGHEAIVRFFAATTSREAHKAWKRRS